MYIEHYLQNDSVKGRGYGTAAERLALKYAFDTLGMDAVNADTVIKNTRSQHVLEKVGFKYMEEKGDFKYYRFDRSFSAYCTKRQNRTPKTDR